MTGLSVVSDAESYDLAYRASGGERGWYRTDGEADVPLVEDRVMELVEQVLETDLSHCVAWQRSDAAAFGLDEPPMKATVRYEDGGGRDAAFTLEYGDYDGDGVYVSFAGSDLIYLTSALGPDALLYPDWTRLTPAAVLTLAVDEIASVRAAFGGAEHELLRLEEETERAVGDDTVTVTDVIWSCNGRVLDGKKTEAWLAALAGLPAETAAYAGEGRQTLLTVTIAWKDAESVPAEVELRSYDSGHCLCVVGGDRSVLVPRSAAEAVLAAAESLFAAA